VNSGPDRRRETFSRDDRLRKRREFEECYASGVRVSGRHLQLFLLPPSGAETASPAASATAIARPRLGISVPRRVGGAVVRNRMKRRFRALAREIVPAKGFAGADHVMIGRDTGIEREYSLLRSELAGALDRLRKQ